MDTMHKLRLRGGVGNVRVVKEQQSEFGKKRFE